MTRSISLAIFFVLILAAVFWFTTFKGGSEQGEKDPAVRAPGPRVEVVSPDQEGGSPKFQLAISTDPSSLNQMNKESAKISARVRGSVVLVSATYKASPPGKVPKKLAGEETRTWLSSGILVGDGSEVLGVIPRNITPLNIQVRFQDGSEVKADFIGRDDSTEIVLLRLPSLAAAKPLEWRNRRSLEWGEHFYAMARNPVHGAQMIRVMVSGDAVLTETEASSQAEHFRQLDLVLPPDFQGAVLLDGDGQVAGLVLQPDAADQLRAVVLDGGSVRVVVEALRSLQKSQ